jgi:hypothetical protein
MNKMIAGTTMPTSATHCYTVFPQTNLQTTLLGEVVETPNLLGRLYEVAFSSLHAYMSTEDDAEGEDE